MIIIPYLDMFYMACRVNRETNPWCGVSKLERAKTVACRGVSSLLVFPSGHAVVCLGVESSGTRLVSWQLGSQE